MGTGYERTDSENNIADNNIIDPDVLDAEFDGVVAAFNSTTGHTHDGTTAEGGPVSFTGPSQETQTTASSFRPTTDATISLGTASLRFTTGYFSGGLVSDGGITVTNNTPGLTLFEADGTSTHSGTRLATASDTVFLQTVDSTGTFVAHNYSVQHTSTGGNLHRWYLEGTEEMRFSADGLGIGTASPDSQLDIEDAGAVRVRVASTDDSSAAVDLTRTGGWSYRLVNDDSGNFVLRAGDLGSGAITDNARITIAPNGDTTINNLFSDKSTGYFGVGSLTPAHFLEVGGDAYIETELFVGQNTTSSPGYGNTTVGFAVRDNGQSSASVDSNVAGSYNRNSTTGTLLTWRYNGASVGTIGVTGAGTTYNTTSDRRLKSNIEDLNESVVDNLKPRVFNMEGADQPVKGFIADEFQEVFPNSVTGEPDGEDMQSMDASSPEVIASLVYEIQQLRKRVAELEKG